VQLIGKDTLHTRIVLNNLMIKSKLASYTFESHKFPNEIHVDHYSCTFNKLPGEGSDEASRLDNV
jgi:hypothetical protein